MNDQPMPDPVPGALWRVEARSFFLPEHSQPELKRFVFAYSITIHNQGEERGQLLERHWIITDAHGRVQEVRGKGVVGVQPVIGPGASYAYSSGCPLATPYGTMRGVYGMVDARDRPFSLEVPAFALGQPPGRTLN